MRARTAVAVVLVGAVGFLAASAGGQTGGQPTKPPAAPPKVPEPKKPKLEPLDRTELDRRIARVVNTAISNGVILWHADNVEGTFRLFQGTLAAIVPLLDHRPELQKTAAFKLKQGSGLRPVEGAFVLREALDEIQKETAVALIVKPLWERLGGEEGVRAVVNDFVAAAAKDPKANLSRGGKYKLDVKELAALEERLIGGFSSMIKGPLPYSGVSVYADIVGLQLTGKEYDALAGHLLNAMKKNKVPDTEVNELMKYIAALKTQPGVVTK